MSGYRASHMAYPPAYSLRDQVLFVVALGALAVALSASLITAAMR